LIGNFSLSELAARLQGQLKGGDANFDAVSIDSRTLASGQLFVAIRGERFDGHQFIAEAARKGACGAVVEDFAGDGIPQLRVADSLQALGRLGNLNRQRSQAKVAAVTGSQGKTTVKEMLGAILSKAGDTWVTRGNLNNAIGVPLNLIGLEARHRYGVFELGANAAGEIAYSVALVEPAVVILTNATPTHLEGFGSLDGVVRAKGEIIDGLAEGGVAVLNADDPHFNVWAKRAAGRKLVSFGGAEGATYRASEVAIGSGGRVQFDLHTPRGVARASLQVLGRHNAMNAAAAAAAAMELGMDLDTVIRGLASVRSVRGRMCLLPGQDGATVIDDSYNASPNSFRAAIDLLAEYRGRRYLIMGDMAEMGSESAAAHAEVGTYARTRGIDGLWATGNLSRLAVDAFGSGGRLFSDQQAMVMACRGILEPSVTLLIKGSRSAAMDKVAEQLTNKEASTC
jgi:UDP-N-acetylmuramoyl-tripeptide--D-alanyl-D-alanine ligase